MVHLSNYITKQKEVHVDRLFPKPARTTSSNQCFMALAREENDNTLTECKVLHVEND